MMKKTTLKEPKQKVYEVQLLAVCTDGEEISNYENLTVIANNIFACFIYSDKNIIEKEKEWLKV